jgi:hypothetical protein
MVCEKCFKQIEDDSKFCIYCGASQVILDGYNKGDLIVYESNGKYGFKDRDSRDIVIPVRYDFIGPFNYNRAVVMINGKYAYVDQNGKELTRFKYDSAKEFKDGFALVKRDQKWAFINLDCIEITPFKYDKIEYFVGDNASVELDGKISIINKSGKELTKIFYDEIENYSESFLKVKLNNKFGLLDGNCNEIISCRYDSIGKMVDGSALVKLDNLFGLIDQSFHETIPCKYDFIGKYSKTLMLIKFNKKCGLINYHGEEVLPCLYDLIGNCTGKPALLKIGSKIGLINEFGNILVDCEYDETLTLSDGTIALQINGLWSAVNSKGEDVSTSNLHFLNFQKTKQKNKIKRIAKKIFLFSIIILLCLLIYDLYSSKLGMIRSIKIIVQGEEKVLWNDFLDSRSSEKLNTYLNKFPNGIYKNEAETSMEGVVWKESISKNTVNSIENYLRRYPFGEYTREAVKEIEKNIMMQLQPDNASYNPLIEKLKEIYTRKVIATYTKTKNKFFFLKVDFQNEKYVLNEIVGIGMYYNIQNDTIMVQSLINGSPSQNAGLHIGDRIIAINGVNCTGITQDEAKERLSGEEGTKIDLYIFHPGSNQIQNHIINREKILVSTNKEFQNGDRFLQSDISYISPKIILVSNSSSAVELSYRKKMPDGNFGIINGPETKIKEQGLVYENFYLSRGVNSISFSFGTGYKIPGKWTRGRYDYIFYIDGVEVCTQSLTVE